MLPAGRSLRRRPDRASARAMIRDVEQMEARQMMRAAMKATKTRQVDLSDRMGVFQSTISGHLNRPNLGLSVFAKVMGAMGYTVAVGKVNDAGTFEPVWELSQDE